MDPKPGCSKDCDFGEPFEDKDDFEEEEKPLYETPVEGYSILDLSDDVLLLILKYCSPRDLKALGFSCPRLGRLICDRSLWCSVDARGRSLDRHQLDWFIDNVVSHHTHTIAVRGFAVEAAGCLGTVDIPRPVIETPPPSRPSKPEAEPPPQAAAGLSRQPCFHIQRHNNPQLPRFNLSPVWRDDLSAEKRRNEKKQDPTLKNTAGCSGPRWTVTRDTMARLAAVCPHLTDLTVEYININCNSTPISCFPATLKRLSMRGSRCYNMQMNKSYLFRIHEFMPLLEYVDVSECGWVEPATLLPLSKLPELRALVLERCRRLSECVAYASLAARYGFRKLEVLNMLGTPMGDSEVSGFGWLPSLRELYLEPATAHEMVEYHSHYLDDPRQPAHLAEPWEAHEPEYFRSDGMGRPRVEDLDLSGIETDDQVIVTGANGRDVARRLAVLHYSRLNETNRGRRQLEILQEAARQRSAVVRRAIELARLRRQRRAPRARPSPPPPSKQRSNSQDAPKVRDSNAPITRSRSQQNIAEKAGPSGCTRSKKAVVELPSTSGSTGLKRKQPQGKDAPKMKKNCAKRSSRRQNEAEEPPAEENAGQNVEDNDELEQGDLVLRQRNDADEYYADGRVHVIYVNVRRPRQDVFRMLIQEGEQRAVEGNREYDRAILNVVEVPRNNDDRAEVFRNGPEFAIVNNEGNRDFANILRLPFIQSFLYGPSATGHISGASLITDAAINRFGRSDNADVVNYVHIGPHGAFRAGAPPANQSERPDKSKLRILVVRGFTGITNRTLNHLVTAAPELRYLDVSGTKITQANVIAFKNLRPECEVKYG